MAKEINIAGDLYDLLATHNFDVSVTDERGQDSSPSEGKVFKFDWVAPSGKNYGTAVIVIGDQDQNGELMLFYGDNLGKAMEEPDKSEWFSFMQQLSKFSTRHNFHTFSPKNLNALKYTMTGIAAIKEGLFEGYYGTKRTSYMGEQTDARLVINHSRMIGEDDKRYRYVESLYIETADKERFKLPFTKLVGGRAMLEHVRQGGRPYDVRGQHITETVNEMGVLSRFRRAQHGRVFEGITQDLVEQANSYYQSLQNGLKHMSSSRGYSQYFESWSPADIGEQESLVEGLRNMFIEQTLDTRIEQALPTLAKIQQQGTAMKEAQIFENWVNQLSEGTWALPDTPEAETKLKELLSQPLIVGPDATNATEQLYDLVGDDQLYDQLSELASTDANADARSIVLARLQELGIDLGIDINATADDGNTDGSLSQAPSDEPLGMPTPMSESRILDEAGETLSHIMDRFKHEVDQFEKGGDLDNDLYYALFDYYSDHGEIPYGIAKGRDGDPFEWVTDRLDQELGTGNYAKRLPEADVLNTFEVMSGFAAPVAEGSCNMTAEGSYCPDHGLAECGGMYEMGTVAGGMAPVMGNANEGVDDPINYNGAITGSYYESKESDALLARIKTLALLK